MASSHIVPAPVIAAVAVLVIFCSIHVGARVPIPAGVNNCGYEHVKCPVPAHSCATCEYGRCGFKCEGWWRDCNNRESDGCETNVADCPESCGWCGHKCPVPKHSYATCWEGKCRFKCLPGFFLIDNCCVPIPPPHSPPPPPHSPPPPPHSPPPPPHSPPPPPHSPPPPPHSPPPPPHSPPPPPHSPPPPPHSPPPPPHSPPPPPHSPPPPPHSPPPPPPSPSPPPPCPSPTQRTLPSAAPATRHPPGQVGGRGWAGG